MCVKCVKRPSLLHAALTGIERFIEENSQTLLQPRLLLQQTRIRNVAIYGIFCISYFKVDQLALSLNIIQIQHFTFLCETRRYSPLRGLSFSSCSGLRPRPFCPLGLSEFKNPAYGRQRISQPMPIVARIPKNPVSKAKFAEKQFFCATISHPL